MDNILFFLFIGGFVLVFDTAFVQSDNLDFTTEATTPETVDNSTACETSFCLNGGTCFSKSSTQCKCLHSYRGERCQFSSKDPCKELKNPCRNNGKCNSKRTNHWGYYYQYKLTCLCPRTHIGPGCYYKNPCFENPCKNGLCVPNDNGIHFKCQCHSGFEGKFCDTPTRVLCLADTCKNNGICHEEFNDAKRIYEAKCYCIDKWGSKDCSEDISDACKSSPCQNNGECRNGKNGTFYCVCKPEFIGENCSIVNPCSKNTCNGFGICVPQVYDGDRYESVCACDRYHAGPNCEVLNPCIENNPCLNGGKCKIYVVISSYTKWNLYRLFGNIFSTGFSEPSCECLSNFGGKTCEILSPCLLNNTCQNNGVCENRYTTIWHNGSFFKEFRTHKCVCPPDFTGVNCETKIVNPCIVEPCKNGGICKVNATNGIECLCFANFYGNTCEKKLYTITSCSFENNLCSDFTTTETSVYQYRWVITSGYTPTYATGPIRAKEGSYYIYTEASYGSYGDKVYLRSKFFTIESESCLFMNYHMYGSTVGTLKVRVENSDLEMTSDEEFFASGDRGNVWHSLKLNVRPGRSRISISSTKGYGRWGDSQWGDIAIDNIVWLSKSCKFD